MANDDLGGLLRGIQPYIPPSQRQQFYSAMIDVSEDAFEALKENIEEFQSGLDQTQEVGICLVSGAGGRTFHAESIRHQAGLFIFSGTMDGKPVRLAQHHTQLNFLLTAVDATAATPRRIGFIPDAESAS